MEIIPAVLEKNLKSIEKTLIKLEPHFSKAQIDVGDGKLVPEKFGCLDKLNQVNTKIDLELHLMTEAPWEKIEIIKEGNFRKISFHYEAFLSIKKKNRAFAINNLINRIKSEKIEVGLAINPETPPNQIIDYIEKVDEVLLLGVNPGKQGQEFQELVLDKINFLKNFREDLLIGLDGGINDKNISLIKKAGIDIVYIGSFLMKSEDIEITLQKLNK